MTDAALPAPAPEVECLSLAALADLGYNSRRGMPARHSAATA